MRYIGTTPNPYGDTLLTSDADDQINVKVAGAEDFRIAANTFEVQTGSNIDMNGTELILDADEDTSITADTDDTIDFRIADADDFQITANTLSVLSGSTLNINSGATIANSGTATGFGASGFVLIETITASDSSSLDFVTGIDGTYDTYALVLTDLVPTVNGANLYIRVTENATDFKAGAADYEVSNVVLLSGVAGFSSALNSVGVAQMQAASANSNVDGEGMNGIIYAFGPSGTAMHQFQAFISCMSNDVTPMAMMSIMLGTYNGSTNAIDGFQLVMSSGNITSGVVALYGLSK